jgi:hypothetical protein
MVKALATTFVIQITCGYNHNLALTQSKCYEFSLKINITDISHVCNCNAYTQSDWVKYCHLSNVFLCFVVGVLTQLL